MKSRWYFPFDGMENTAFERVPEGWAYSAPNPWLFGRRPTYLVNDEQKTAIAARLRCMWRALFIAIIVLAGVAGPIAFPSVDARPLVTLAGAMLTGAVVGSVIVGAFVWKIRPLLAGLPASTHHISRRDVFAAQVAAFSRGRILFFALLSLAMFALSALPPLLTSGGWEMPTVAGALLFGFGTLYWLGMYVAKRRRVRAAA
jgi:hypothetical protein